MGALDRRFESCRPDWFFRDWSFKLWTITLATRAGDGPGGGFRYQNAIDALKSLGLTTPRLSARCLLDRGMDGLRSADDDDGATLSGGPSAGQDLVSMGEAERLRFREHLRSLVQQTGADPIRATGLANATRGLVNGPFAGSYLP